jgi:hypothetical protein
MSLDDRSFSGPSPVGRYWIAHSEGFAVESPAGRPVGTVEAVAVDPQTAEPMLVLERTAVLGRRRGVVPAGRIALVLPWSERLVLGRPQRADSATTLARPAVEKAAQPRRFAPALAASRTATAASAVARAAARLALAVARAAARGASVAADWVRRSTPVAVERGRARLAPHAERLRAFAERCREHLTRDVPAR